MYEVRINADPEDFLDWDKPLSEQSEKVREMFHGLSPETQGMELYRAAQGLDARERPKLTGDTMRDFIAQGWHDSGASTATKRGASEEVLKNAGIPGIRYLDQGSRTAGEGSRNYVVFDDKLIEIVVKDGVPVARGNAMFAMSDSATGRSMREDIDSLGYYSGALRAAKAWPQSKGTVEQALTWLKKSGVKEGEIETTGLAKAIEGQKAVTRDEIVAHLEKNRVGLNEVVRGNGFDGEASKTTKWSSNSLDPGNPSYRETVLHLPGKETIEEYAKRMGIALTPATRRIVESSRGMDTRVDFNGGHFPEPNITGHMMTSMVKDIDGRPVYLIDQIQSDWGQKLRDGGVRDEGKVAELREKVEGLKSRFGAADAFYAEKNLKNRVLGGHDATGVWQKIYKDDAAKSDHDTFLEMDAAEKALRPEFNRLSAELSTAEASVSGHPLVNTTDQWTNTTLRRALRQAADADAEFIAIPSGKTVESYNPQGDSAGNAVFYDQIVPKNLKNILKKLDRAAAEPRRVDQLDTPTRGMKGDGFTVFEITPEVKRKITSDGQPLFAFTGYHGTNALFDEVDLDFVNAGAKSQKFGFGFYASSRKQVGANWAHTIARNNSGSPQLYTVTLDAEPYQLMRWEARLKDQPETIRRAVEAVAAEHRLSVDADSTGESVYRALAKKKGERDASMILRDAGIRGNVQSNTTARNGTFDNFVMFDEADVRVETREAAPGPQQARPDPQDMADDIRSTFADIIDQVQQVDVTTAVREPGAVMEIVSRNPEIVATLTDRVQALTQRYGVDAIEPEAMTGLVNRIMADVAGGDDVVASVMKEVQPLMARAEVSSAATPAVQSVTLPDGAEVKGAPFLMYAIKTDEKTGKRYIQAFHGTPHDFDRFRLDKIGSGEGAQVYGRGLYFAESEDIARWYRDSVADKHEDRNYTYDRTNWRDVLRVEIRSAGGDRQKAIKALEDEWVKWGYANPQNSLQRYRAEAMGEAISKLKNPNFDLSRFAPPPRRLYEVRIDIDPDQQVLDWDAPLSEQSSAVRALAQRYGADLNMRGGDFHARISKSGEDATRVLVDAGISGVRYLDASSRRRGNGTRNFVVFDDSLIKIVSKDGVPVGDGPLYTMAGDGSYRGQHSAPDSESGSPLHDVTLNGIYPSDFYGANGLRYYGTGDDALDRAAYSKILKMKGKPDEMVAVYRAIPFVKGKRKGLTLGARYIIPGDWVAITRQYAVDHGESALGGEYHIVKRMVPAKELFTSGDSFHEWGWAPPQAVEPMFAMRSDLDMSPEARKKRAEEMGFDTGTVLYHGTSGTFDEFRVSDRGKMGPGVYLATDAGYAGRYVGNESPSIMPVYVRGKIGTLADHAPYSDMARELTLNVAEWKKTTNELMAGDGFAGYQVQNEIVVFDPRNIRSVNAAFDPAKADSPNLMYAMRDDRGRIKRGAAERAQTLAADLAEIEADIKAGTIDDRAALQQKRASLLNARSEDVALNEFRAHRNNRGEQDSVHAFLRMHETKGRGGFAGADLWSEKTTIANEALRRMSTFVWEARKGAITGDKRRTGKYVGSATLKARMDNMMREAAGENTGDEIARKMAKGWLDGAEWLRQQFNAFGGDIGKLKGWIAPQYHDAQALLTAGRDAWVKYMMADGMLDRDRMLDRAGNRLGDDDLRDLLSDIWVTVTTGGANKREVTGRAGKGALYKRHAEHRVLHFRNADAFIKYTRDFGGGDLYAMMVGHVQTMARDIAALKRFGANPDLVRTRLIEHLRKEALEARSSRSVYDDLADLVADLKTQAAGLKGPLDDAMRKIADIHTELDTLQGRTRHAARRLELQKSLGDAHAEMRNAISKGPMTPEKMDLLQRIVKLTDEMATIADDVPVMSRDPVTRTNRIIKRADEMWKLYTGHTNTPVDGMLASGMVGIRNVISSSTLAFAPISALTDQATGLAARSFVGMPVVSQLASFVKGFTKTDRQAALQFSLGLDQVDAAFAQQSRFAGWINTRSLTGYLADRGHAFSFLSPMTQAAKVGFGMDFMAWMAKLARAHTFEALEPWTRDMLVRHGFTPDDWARLRTVTPEMHRGVPLLSFPAIASQVGEDIAEKYQRVLLRERSMAVLEPTMQGRAVWVSDNQSGTIIGEMLRSTAMLKSFPTSYAMLILGRFYDELLAGHLGRRNTLAAAGAIFIVGTLLGALVRQSKSLTQGRDAEDMTEPEFWAKSFMQSGGAGIFGDFIASAYSRNGAGFGETLAGPVVGRAVNVWNLTAGNLIQYARDEPTHTGREAVTFARQNTPLLPWYVRSVYERAILDQIQKQVDPDVHKSMQSRVRLMKKLNGTDFYYPPGAIFPTRAPNLERAFGAN